MFTVLYRLNFYQKSLTIWLQLNFLLDWIEFKNHKKIKIAKNWKFSWENNWLNFFLIIQLAYDIINTLKIWNWYYVGLISFQLSHLFSEIIKKFNKITKSSDKLKIEKNKLRSPPPPLFPYILQHLSPSAASSLPSTSFILHSS